MPRTRLDDDGQVTIKWSNGALSIFRMEWRERLAVRGDEMFEAKAANYDISELPAPVRTKITAIITAMQAHRDSERPIT